MVNTTQFKNYGDLQKAVNPWTDTTVIPTFKPHCSLMFITMHPEEYISYLEIRTYFIG